MQALEREAEEDPEREEIWPDEAVDVVARVRVVPRGAATRAAEHAARRVFDRQNPAAVGERARRERSSAETVVERLKERLR